MVSTLRISVLTKYSSFLKLQRIVAYLLRLERNMRSFDKHLSLAEFRKAHDVVMKRVQRQEFENEIAILIKGHCLNKNSQIQNLHLFLDNTEVQGLEVLHHSFILINIQ